MNTIMVLDHPQYSLVGNDVWLTNSGPHTPWFRVTRWPRLPWPLLCWLTGQWTSLVVSPPALPCASNKQKPWPAVRRDLPRWLAGNSRRLPMKRGHCCWRISETGQGLGVTQILVGSVPTFYFVLDSNRECRWSYLRSQISERLQAAHTIIV